MEPIARLGLFGGSFNPVHLGHLLVAQAAREELALDRVVFIPAAHSPFKPETELAPAAARLQLLRLALAGESRFEIDEQELARGGVSYTIDTVRDYARRFAGAHLHYLIGTDLVAQLPAWRDAESLARLVEFVLIPRPGEAPPTLPAPFRLRPLRGFPLGVSASQIRERVRSGQAIDWLTPPAVAEAIRNNRLYL
jgi:nicotinate-nucleotide adenylyltransferase